MKIPERITGNRRRSHSRINQEEVNQTHQAENQVEIQSSDQSDNGKFKVDSRERKLSENQGRHRNKCPRNKVQ